MQKQTDISISISHSDDKSYDSDEMDEYKAICEEEISNDFVVDDHYLNMLMSWLEIELDSYCWLHKCYVDDAIVYVVEKYKDSALY